jgi:hypothetical protein
MGDEDQKPKCDHIRGIASDMGEDYEDYVQLVRSSALRELKRRADFYGFDWEFAYCPDCGKRNRPV